MAWSVGGVPIWRVGLRRSSAWNWQSARSAPVWPSWAYLLANKLGFTVFDTFEDILEKCEAAWNFFAKDPQRIPSITHRDWITVN